MTKENMWGDRKKQSVHRKKTNREYEGGAEKLLQYADTHPSFRELAKMKIEAELRRWGIEQRPPRVEEIQQRYNYTAEYAGKFLKKLEKARRATVKNPVVKIVRLIARAPLVPLTPAPIEQGCSEENCESVVAAQLKLILTDIRGRYGDEIRQKGEQTSAKEGFVYLVTNSCFSGWIKAGMTIDYELRLGTYNTSDPLSRFEYLELAWASDRRCAERRLLSALKGIAAETQGEWFRLHLKEARLIFHSFMRSLAEADIAESDD